MLFHACVDLLGKTPRQALKGMSKQEMLKLIVKHQNEGKSIRAMMK